MINDIFNRLENIYQEMVDIRRDLHKHPELSFQEERTPEVIAQYQRQLGLEVRTGVGGNGVVATLHGGKPGKTVAIRADFDALPIFEKNDVPYKSVNDGVMHACGHDAHTAIALGLAKVLAEKKAEIEGNVVFIHQHAEEMNPGGAIGMFEDGCLEGVDAIFATHMENYCSVGQVFYSEDYILAASDRFEIEVNGVGGHGAFPQDTRDAVVIGSQLVSNLQQIISRRVDPLKSAVLTIGSFKAGEAANVIADQAILKGTVRTFDADVRDQVEEMMETMTAHTCKASGASYKFTYDRGFPATLNHEKETKLLVESAKQVINEEDIIAIPPNMGGEDFSYFLQKVPGTYFFTGSANKDKGIIYPYHHPKFDIDEESLLIGSKILAAATINYLNQN
ncbi:M20 family metallopeptidase [Aquibacillus albus]|uniref:Amidohydrolase n=1 Tax=Aquibacillus albus TaxID=1168171 RepID=A0ABS2MXI8_9BACI|nr:M20 family metallopeptidase [Aquibacillus albus]MBM7570498.1 amidohydrolase [Aquibacillus albus]